MKKKYIIIFLKYKLYKKFKRKTFLFFKKQIKKKFKEKNNVEIIEKNCYF